MHSKSSKPSKMATHEHEQDISEIVVASVPIHRGEMLAHDHNAPFVRLPLPPGRPGGFALFEVFFFFDCGSVLPSIATGSALRFLEGPSLPC